MNPDRERQELLELFYQCPVGLLEIDDRGSVNRINPAAARMLTPALGDNDLTMLFPFLRRLAPELVAEIKHHPERLGRLGDSRRVFIPSGRPGDVYVELLTVRVQFDRVMIVLVEVTADRVPV